MLNLFRRKPRKKDAAAFVEKARGVVAILSLSRADVSAMEALLDEAERAVEDSPRRAIEAAEKAERLATAVESDHRAMTEAVAALTEHAERLDSLGIPATEFREAIDALPAAAAATRDVEGLTIPDYASARALAEESATAAERILTSYDRATDAVFAAELAIENAAEAFGGGSVEALEEARSLLEQARGATSNGSYDVASTDAGLAEQLAVGAMDQKRRAEETLASVERVVNGLKSIGIPVSPVSRSLDIGRTLLAKGKLNAAIDVLNESAQEAVSLGNAYRQALDALSSSMTVIDVLRQEGLQSPQAESALGRAKAAVKEGNYNLAFALTEDVQREVQKQRETRDGLRDLLQETKAQVEALRGLGVSYVNDVEEMIARAEEEFENGEYAVASEDLRIATLLMAPAMNGRERERPEGP